MYVPSTRNVYVSTHSSPQSLVNVFAPGQENINDAKRVPTPPRSGLEHQAQQNSYPVAVVGSPHRVDTAMNLCVPEDVASAEAADIFPDVNISDVPDMSFIDWVKTGELGDIFQASEKDLGYYGTEMAHTSDEVFIQDGTTQLSREDSAHLSDTYWDAIIDWSQTARSSIRGSGDIIESPDTTALSPLTIISRAADAPRNPLIDEVREQADQLHGLPYQSASVIPRYLNKIIFQGANPEAVIPPLSFLESQILVPQDSSLSGIVFSSRSSFGDVVSIVGSEWLEFQIGDVLCGSHEESLKAIRQHQAARKATVSGERIDSSTKELSEVVEAPGARIRPKEAGLSASDLQPNVTSHIVFQTTTGRLMVNHGEISTPFTRAHYGVGLQMISVSFTPRARERTIGVFVRFIKVPNASHGPPIRPYIKTFNVIPEDSEVFQLIAGDDLQGLRGLFDSGKASPFDVDSHGYSLLAVSCVYLDSRVNIHY
ncbi:hypothetical protein OEA41_000521 [Lepraria neglecta]|uniref:Uncharacterized protein n=1 Tax=Lepraria neglecta TaxID=209136 RepID=A0AAD9ZHC5_9LECA|nr:hypothetical protein OEA41_000521 [Lepraria neglecta]